MQYTVVTIGGAVIDAFLHLSSSSSTLSVDKASRTLRIPYGEKIPLEKIDLVLGGNACNVSVGLTRLGIPTALMAEIGADEFAQKIFNTLTREGVGTDFLLRGEGQTSMSIGINFQEERTLFVGHQRRKHAFTFSTLETEWVYLTSLGPDWHHVYTQVLEYKKKKPNIKIAFNPGTLQLKEGLRFIEPLLNVSPLLFLNKDEATRLVQEKDVSTDVSMEDLLYKLQSMGSPVVVITNGDQGAAAVDTRRNVVIKEALHVPVIERTGAGDSFATGFLASCILGKDIEESMLWGTKNAAAVIGEVGSQAGLLTREEMVSER